MRVRKVRNDTNRMQDHVTDLAADAATFKRIYIREKKAYREERHG